MSYSNIPLSPPSSSSVSPRRLGAFFSYQRLFFTLIGLLLLFYLLIGDGPVTEPPSNSKTQPVLASEQHLSNNASSCTPVAGRPAHQYALMLDAGSSGSRIHVYRFNYCSGPSPTLEKEVFEQLKPGLSSVDFTTPRQAADSLNPLLTVALETVPKELWKCTPIALKATAGLRMKRPEGSGQKIIDAVKSKLENDYPFNLVEDGVSIMLGKDEGS